MGRKIEIMDTTLRDGEQTSGVSFTDQEKLKIARLLLEELKVDRIEIASAHVSEGEFAAVKQIMDWAKEKGYIDRIEILGFVDGDRTLNWMRDSGAKVLNLLTKGSERHCVQQLRKTKEEHRSDFLDVLTRADQQGIRSNVYLEDWSNGMRTSPEYVYYLLEGLSKAPVHRILLPDTLGILNPDESFAFCSDVIQRFPTLSFDFHAHNDYDLATANVMAAVKAGVAGVHVTLNGLGERAGNVSLSSVVGVLKDHLHCEVAVDEKKLYSVSKLVESYSGVRIPTNKPIVGEFVFTQTSGIHADGDQKGNLYHNNLSPERFNRKHSYALGKMAGKSSIRKNLDELGIELDQESMRLVTKAVNELGDRKEVVTQEDLPYIIADVLEKQTLEQRVRIKNYALSVAAGLRSVATLSIEIDGKSYERTADGDGQYDAFMSALRQIYQPLEKALPRLIDYVVTIPPGGKTDALCHTAITWKKEDGRIFKTSGLDSDQAIAAIKATIKMLNLI